ncbi:MAG: hypothetical protein ACOCXQ_01905 [Patescibacteria group bacterium]
MNVVLFLVLYVVAFLKTLYRRKGAKPQGIAGSVLLRFRDPAFLGRTFGVVAFRIPEGTVVETYGELFGPFGYSSQTHITGIGMHLYGRDTWGFVNEEQLKANPELQNLAQPGELILLAGVRGIRERFIWPMNKSERFILTKASS